MQLSTRVTNLKPSATLEVSARAKAMKASGIDVLGFGAGEPDFDTPEHIKRAAAKALHDGWTKYVAAAGDPTARNVIAEKLRTENHLKWATADHIVITSGAKMAIYLAIQSLVDPGQEVIFPTPCWVSYAPIAELAGASVVEIPTTAATEFKMSAADLRAKLTPKSRAIILNSPCNPTGSVYLADEWQAIANVVNEHNRSLREDIRAGRACELVVISDEIYEKLAYAEPNPTTSIARWLEGDASVTVNGLSKSYAMTGWRIGYAAAASPALAKAMAKMQTQMTTSITACCYPAIVQALEAGQADIDRMRATYARRRDLIYDLVAALPDVTTTRPDGAFYIFPDVSAYFGRKSPEGRAISSSVEFAEALLQEAHVAVVPGDDFGGCGINHIRLSYACSDDQIREGLARIHRFLDRLR